MHLNNYHHPQEKENINSEKTDLETISEMLKKILDYLQNPRVSIKKNEKEFTDPSLFRK